MNSKIALIFLVVLAVVLKSSQGKSIHEIKDDIKDVKKPLIVAKLGIAKLAAAKIKLGAIKKWAAVKFIAKAPFVLGKKVALLKVNAIKSLAAFKAAKAKKVLGFAAPAVAAVAGGISAKVTSIPAKVAGISDTVAGIPAKVASISAAVAGIPAAAVAALKPKPAPHSQLAHHTEVVDIITYPDHAQHYQEAQHHIPANTHYYKSGLDGPRTYSNDYSLVPEYNSGSQQYPVSDIIQPHNIYGVPAN